MEFKFRIGDLELRSCDEDLLQRGKHIKAEIVKWTSNDTCYLIAVYNQDNDGYFDLKFVGNRPFDADQEMFMLLAKMGQEILDKHKF